jgi:hypothetical protein
MSIEAGLGETAQRPDRVYVTTNRDLAREYAWLWTPDGVHHGKGALYRVSVELEDLEPDEDLLSLTGLSSRLGGERCCPSTTPASCST